MATIKRRIKGAMAVVEVAGVAVGELQEVDIEVSVDMIEHRADQDTWKGREPDVGEWKVTAKKLVAYGVSSVGVPLEAAYGAVASVNYKVTVYAVAGQPNTKLIEGYAWCQRGTFRAAQGAIEEEDFEFIGVGSPDFIAGYTLP